MNAIRDACARWIALSDREAMGEVLTAAEKAFARAHLASCTACRAEADVWGEMRSLLDVPREGHRVHDGKPAATLVAGRRAWENVPRRDGPWLTGARALGLCLAVAAMAAAIARHRAPHDRVPNDRAPRDPQAVPDLATAPSSLAAAPSSLAAAPKDATAILTVAGGGPVDVDGRPGTVGQTLERGAVVSSREGSACLAVLPAARACIARGTMLRLADPGPNARLELLGGKVAIELDPLPPGSSFAISTRGGSAIAVGTAFSVEVPPDDAPVVTRVLHGVVLVRASNGTEQRVAAHETTSMRDAKPTPLSPVDEERERALLIAPPYDGATVRAVIDSDLPGATVRIDERTVGIAPIELLLTRGDHAVAIAAPSRGTAHETLHVGIEPLVRRFTLPAAPAPPSSGAIASTERTPSAKRAAELLAAARVRRADGDLSAAIGAYRELFERHGASAEAHAALVPWGELQLAPLSDPRGALAAFDRYMMRGGPLEQEASFGRIRALRALGRTDDERAAIESFVQRFPDGSLTSSLRERLRSMDDR
ncbi:PEGA domain-containing protein [Pendulispora albinea]|uniref:PEGA domain-containing protein n=1 Tax=Pendulispora albinea TaxID=2741071 RepID=A0ABZ2M7L1_9BACT